MKDPVEGLVGLQRRPQVNRQRGASGIADEHDPPFGA